MSAAPPLGPPSKVSSCRLHDDEASNEPRKHLISSLGLMGAGTTGVRGQTARRRSGIKLDTCWSRANWPDECAAEAEGSASGELRSSLGEDAHVHPPQKQTGFPSQQSEFFRQRSFSIMLQTDEFWEANWSSWCSRPRGSPLL